MSQRLAQTHLAHVIGSNPDTTSDGSRMTRQDAALSAARGGAIFVAVLGALVLILGFWANIRIFKSFLPDLIPATPNAAAAFFLSGVSLYLLQHPEWNMRPLSRTAAVAVGLIGLLTVLEHVLGFDLHIDQLLAKDTSHSLWHNAPGRMSLATAFNFLLLSGALCVLDRKGPWAQRFSSASGSIAFMTSILVLIGWFYDPFLPLLPQFIWMSLPVGIGFLVLSLAAAFTFPDRGWPTLALSDSAGGMMIRSLLPAVIAIPLAVALVTDNALFVAAFGDTFASALHVFLTVMTLLIVMLFGATMLHRTDLTRRGAEERLRRLSMAVEQSPNMVVITSAKGVIEYINPKFSEVTGYSAEEAVGKTPALFKSGLTPDDKYKDLWATIASGREWRGEFLNRTKTGELFWCEETIAPVYDEKRITHFVAVETDVTERKKFDERLRQAQRMETVGTLAGGIAHDFNNLLMVACGNLDLLMERLADRPDLRVFADHALHAAERSASLTRQMLAFARRQILQPQTVDVWVLVNNMSGILRSSVKESVTVNINMPEGLWHTLADPVQLENVLLNLTLNARDAMPEGGAITIEAANVELSRGDLQDVPSVVPGPYVRIAVSDNGSGMSPEVRTRAFEPFFTTKEVGKGTGLGLSMVYGFVKQSEGYVEIESAPGRGTRIDLYLPKAESTHAVEAIRDVSSQDVSGAPKIQGTILVVEDNDQVRAVAVNLLRQMGHHVIEASDGPAALKILESNGAIDLLFTDIVMPGGMSGWELTRRALHLNPRLKVLVTTGYTDETPPADFVQAKAVRLLMKPYRQSALVEALDAVLAVPAIH